jgi:hypothetical protein
MSRSGHENASKKSLLLESVKKSGCDARMVRLLFEEKITVSHVVENLVTCNDGDDAVRTADLMKRMKFDVMGIKSGEGGVVYGYVVRSELREGRCGDFARTFHPKELASDSMSIAELFASCKNLDRLFVVSGNAITGIVTRADLRKQPVRLYVFGLMALLEMHFLNLVRVFFPDESWKDLLSKSRIEMAEKLFESLQERNEDIDLADCIQLCDKNKIVISKEETRHILGFSSKSGGKRLLEKVVQLRNRLVHAQDIVSGSTWMDLIELIEYVKFMIARCEEHGSARYERIQGGNSTTTESSHPL